MHAVALNSKVVSPTVSYAPSSVLAPSNDGQGSWFQQKKAHVRAEVWDQMHVVTCLREIVQRL